MWYNLRRRVALDEALHSTDDSRHRRGDSLATWFLYVAGQINCPFPPLCFPVVV